MAPAPASLAGLRVLITRPAAEAEETADLVRAAGGEPLIYPCLALGPPPDPAALCAALDEGAEIVVITSANAARSLAQLRPDLAAALAPSLVVTVGERTAAALRQTGVRVDLVAQRPTAEGLYETLRRARPALAGRRVLFPRAAEGREELVARLQEAGAALRAPAAYAMTPAPPERLAGAVAALGAGAVDLVPLGSPRTAQVLLAALGPDGPALLRRCAVGAVGETTAAALREGGVAVDVVGEGASFAALIALLAERRRGRW